MKSVWLKRIPILLLGLLVGMQFIQIDKTNPPIDSTQDLMAQPSIPPGVKASLEKACLDCHSHQTVYPWYTYISPINYWIKDHIEHGRSHLNFSIWGTYSNKKARHKMEECIEEVQENHMPLSSYTWMHSEAKLSDSEKQALLAWFENKMNNYPVE